MCRACISIPRQDLRDRERSRTTSRRSRATVETAVPLQPGLRERLRHGARRPSRCCCSDPRDADGAGVVREKELGSITNLYVTPGHAPRIPARQAAALRRRRDCSTSPCCSLMAAVVFGVPLKGSFLDALCWGRCSTSSATTGFGLLISDVHPHADRRALRHRHPHRPAGDAVLRHVHAGLVADGLGLRSWGTDLPDDLFPADQRRHLHQGARASGSRRQPAAHSPSSSRC